MITDYSLIGLMDLQCYTQTIWTGNNLSKQLK